MRIGKFVLLSLFGLLASGGDGGCFGRDPDEPRPDGGVEPLTVRAKTVKSGPFASGSIVELEAEATGGLPPYLFTWKEPAMTIDASLGLGQIAASAGASATIAVVDSNGDAATDTIAIPIEGVVELTIERRGPGRVSVGFLGTCDLNECIYHLPAGTALELVAVPAGDARFEGWAGCSSSTSPAISIRLAGPSVCTAVFGAGFPIDPCDAMPPPPAPTADIVVRPTLTDPPFAKDASGYFVVPRNFHVLIDGRGSTFSGASLTFAWGVSWDPLNEVPEFSVSFFEILSPGFGNQRTEAYLTVTDGCGRTATSTATYITE
jgi:hypothetical protein